MSLELIIRTSAILACGAGIAAMLRRAAPSTRHLVWQIAITAVVLAPYLIALAPRVPIVPVVPQVPQVSISNPAGAVSIEIDAERGTQPTLTLRNVGTLGTALVGSWFLLCWIVSGLSVWRGSTPAPQSWINEARSIGCRLGLRR